MTFTDAQKAELAKPLDRSTVKERKQAGRKLSYVEGWHVIAEANRIFGFDGWQRETVLLTETNRDLVHLTGDNGPYDQWRIGYIAKVRVTVGDVIREGTGYGSGMGKPEAIGDAVEGAIKEAETDAMKRALMTFGNPFGLALYDKTQANVADEPPQPPQAPAIDVNGYLQMMDDATNLETLQSVCKEAWKAHTGANSRNSIKSRYDARKTALTPIPKTLGDHLDKLEREAATNPH
jgi:DNA repair and recombination protein RAD52